MIRAWPKEVHGKDGTAELGCEHFCKCARKCKKKWDIQQLKFAGGHPPNYYAAGRMLKYARADGMACFHSPVVVCNKVAVLTSYILETDEAEGEVVDKGQVTSA